MLNPLDKESERPGGLPSSSNHFPEEKNANCLAGAECRQSRGHKFARYADAFIVTGKSANAAKWVLASLIRFTEGRLQLIVNRVKSRAAPQKSCEFAGVPRLRPSGSPGGPAIPLRSILGYRLNNRAKLAWTQKARIRFKEQVRQWERSGHRVPGGEPREG